MLILPAPSKANCLVPQEPFEPFRKIFEAPLQDDDIARIAAALSDGGGAALATEAADLLHRFSVLIDVT